MTSTAASTPRPPPYRIAIWLGWTKVALVGIVVLVMLTASGQDPAGSGMAGGLAAIAAAYILLFVVPALRLAYQGRSLGWSFALLLVPDALLLLAIGFL